MNHLTPQQFREIIQSYARSIGTVIGLGAQRMMYQAYLADQPTTITMNAFAQRAEYVAAFMRSNQSIDGEHKTAQKIPGVDKKAERRQAIIEYIGGGSYTSKQIAKALNITNNMTWCALRDLRKSSQVIVKPAANKFGKYTHFYSLSEQSSEAAA